MSALCMMKNGDLSSLATLLVVWGQRRRDSLSFVQLKGGPHLLPFSLWLICSSKTHTYVSPGHLCGSLSQAVDFSAFCVKSDMQCSSLLAKAIASDPPEQTGG